MYQNTSAKLMSVSKLIELNYRVKVTRKSMLSSFIL